jgi:hypothetical protein
MNTQIESTELANGLTHLKTLDVTKGKIIKPQTKRQKSTTPLAPESVTAVSSTGVITIKMTVLINAKATIDTLDIYTELGYSSVKNGKIITTKPIYVIYDYTEEIPTSLYPYTFTFTIADKDGSINEIASYLYDKDPVTSRGTTTTVKKEM